MSAELKEESIKKRVKCPNCESGQVYIRIDKTVRCRVCGFDNRVKKK